VDSRRPDLYTAAPSTGGRQGEGRALAAGSATQALAQALGLLGLLAIVTVLARRLSLAELGVYGLVSTLAGYLLVLHNSVSVAATARMAAARAGAERSQLFGAAALLYALAGLATGTLIVAVGALLAWLVALEPGLAAEARRGALGLALVTAVGLPVTVGRDALRAAGLYSRAAGTEIVAVALNVALMLALALGGAPLWLLIAASGMLPLLGGLLALPVARASAVLPPLPAPRAARGRTGELLPTAGDLFAVELANLVIYGFDRVILGVLRSATAVGLYEGPIRAHNLVRALNLSVAVTVVPAASRLRAAGDTVRLRELLVRGSRYVAGLVVPLVVTLMALAAPVLEVWLGPEFREAAPAMTILLSYWLLAPALGFVTAALVGFGRSRQYARLIWAAAAANLVLSMALTPSLGLEGVALGTAVPMVVVFPALLTQALEPAGLRVAELARRAWAPAYVLGALLGAALIAARLAFELDTLAPLLLAGGAGLALYWAAYVALFLTPGERALLTGLLRGRSV
jgi:O-antigen/teichoic acid export membrane protein